jgi:hypothetical protein
MVEIPSQLVEAASRLMQTFCGRVRPARLLAVRPQSTDRQALHPWELIDDDLAALRIANPPFAAAAFDHELKED